MKTSFLRTSLFAAVAALMASCGGDGLDAGTCIESAEEIIELEESPLLGELPSLSDQWLRARQTANGTFDQLYETDMRKLKDGEIDAEKLSDRQAELFERKGVVLKEIDEYFYPKMKEVAEGFKGKEIPVKFDTSVFTSAKVSIKEVEVDPYGGFDVLLDIKLGTVAEPSGSPYAYEAQMLDGSGKVLIFRDASGQSAERRVSFGLTPDGRPQVRFGSDNLFYHKDYHDGASIYFGK